MRSGAFAIEHACGSDQADTGTNARDGRTALMPSLQPRHNGCVALDDIVQAEARCRNEDEIGVADTLDCRHRLDMNRAVAEHRLPIHRSWFHFEARLYRLSREMVPQRPGMSEDFHGTHCGRGKSLIEQQNGNFNHESFSLQLK